MRRPRPANMNLWSKVVDTLNRYALALLKPQLTSPMRRRKMPHLHLILCRLLVFSLFLGENAFHIHTHTLFLSYRPTHIHSFFSRLLSIKATDVDYCHYDLPYLPNVRCLLPFYRFRSYIRTTWYVWHQFWVCFSHYSFCQPRNWTYSIQSNSIANSISELLSARIDWRHGERRTTYVRVANITRAAVRIWMFSRIFRVTPVRWHNGTTTDDISDRRHEFMNAQARNVKCSAASTCCMWLYVCVLCAVWAVEGNIVSATENCF